MEFIIGLVVVLIILALVVFPGFRKKLGVLVNGFLNVFVEDMAKTPEGAEAVFVQAIDELRDKYSKACDTLNKLSGELLHAERAVVSLGKNITDTEKTCERFVQSGDMKNAEIYASRRAELIAELEQKKECVARLKPMVTEATQIQEAYERKLREMERSKKETVSKLKMNNQMKDLYGDLDELKRDTAKDKMLGAVMDGAKDLQKEVDGARIVYENRASTKVARAEQKATQLKNDEYLESLKKKYGGK